MIELLTFIATIFGPIIWFIDRKKKSLTFFEVKNVNLYNGLNTRMPNIVVTVNGNSVTSDMFLLRGIFYCDGRVDIKNNNGKLQVVLDNGIWLNEAALAETYNLDLLLNRAGNTLDFDFTLLKKGDFFFFEGLNQSSDGKYSVRHRLQDLGGIRPSPMTKDLSKAFLSVVSLFVLGLLSVVLYTITQVNFLDLDVKYKTTDDKVFSKDYDLISHIYPTSFVFTDSSNTVKQKEKDFKKRVDMAKDSLTAYNIFQYMYKDRSVTILRENVIVSATLPMDGLQWSTVGLMLVYAFTALFTWVMITAYFQHRKIIKALKVYIPDIDNQLFA